MVGFEVLPVPGGRGNLQGPFWVATLIGLIVLLAGAACVLQSIGRANARAEFPANAPFWMRAAQYLIGVALFADFAVLGTWVAFLGEGRHFSGGVPFLGTFNISLVRLMFGAGALICWFATIGYAIAGARKVAQSQHAVVGRKCAALIYCALQSAEAAMLGACGHSSAAGFPLRVQSRP